MLTARLPLLLLLALPAWGACPPVHRSQAVLRAFRAAHPCPATGATTGPCPGYVLDHRYPLCAGGKDEVANLAWQPQDLSYDKDRLERELCRLKYPTCRPPVATPKD